MKKNLKTALILISLSIIIAIVGFIFILRGIRANEFKSKCYYNEETDSTICID